MPATLPSRPADRKLLASALFALSLVFLFIGNFIQFNDTSGFGYNEWRMPFAFLAVLAVAGSVVVGLPDASARRLLGWVMLVLDALVVMQMIVNDGFRFVWEDDEGELFQFVVLLGIAGLALLTRAVYEPSEPTPGPGPTELAPPKQAALATFEMTPWARFVAYLAATVVLVFVAFSMGATHFENTECSGPDFGGECDLAGLEGMVWAAGVILLAVIAIPTFEVVRHLRRSRR